MCMSVSLANPEAEGLSEIQVYDTANRSFIFLKTRLKGGSKGAFVPMALFFI